MAAADFGRIKVGADCLIDKKSLKYGTDVGQYLVVSKIHPSLTPVQRHHFVGCHSWHSRPRPTRTYVLGT